MTEPNEVPLLEVRGIVKQYPGVLALDKVDFGVRCGEVHCLAGENGAGKSTLIEIIGGSYPKDAGTLMLEGKEIVLTSPRHAQTLGIAVLHQELPVLPDLSVAENIFLHRQPRTRLGTIQYGRMYREARKWLDIIQADINPRAPLGGLPTSKQQLVSIAKALSLEAKVIVFDEPSAVLTSVELKRLFEIIRSMKAEGKGIVYISHRLEEIFEIGDRVTVLRNGKLMGTEPTTGITREALIRMLVGREVIEESYQARSRGTEQHAVLEVEALRREGVFEDVSLRVRQGEILGIYGLVGAGRTEVARAILGADPIHGGTIRVDGHPVSINSPREAIRHGIGLAPEDRKRQGVLLGKSVQDNIALPSLRRLRNSLFLSYPRISRHAAGFVKKLKIATPHLDQKVRFLSGGNQQKVVLAKWLGVNLKIFIFDEPTRGIDVGAKQEIRGLIRDLAEQGKGIILISSEIPEILSMSDRIIVMHSGRVIRELPRAEATKEKLIAYSMGVREQ